MAERSAPAVLHRRHTSRPSGLVVVKVKPLDAKIFCRVWASVKEVKQRLQEGHGVRVAWARLFGEFCASSAVAVGVQLGVAAALRFRAPGGAAQLCGILCGTAINFAAQNWVVFRARGARSDEKLSTDLRSV